MLGYFFYNAWAYFVFRLLIWLKENPKKVVAGNPEKYKKVILHSPPSPALSAPIPSYLHNSYSTYTILGGNFRILSSISMNQLFWQTLLYTPWKPQTKDSNKIWRDKKEKRRYTLSLHWKYLYLPPAYR